MKEPKKAKKPIEVFTDWANENLPEIIKKSGNTIFQPLPETEMICMGIGDGELYLSRTMDKNWAWNKGTINGVTFWYGTHTG